MHTYIDRHFSCDLTPAWDSRSLTCFLGFSSADRSTRVQMPGTVRIRTNISSATTAAETTQPLFQLLPREMRGMLIYSLQTETSFARLEKTYRIHNLCMSTQTANLKVYVMFVCLFGLLKKKPQQGFRPTYSVPKILNKWTTKVSYRVRDVRRAKFRGWIAP